MEKNKELKKKIAQIKNLKTVYRIILYFITLIFSTMALMDVFLQIFPEIISIIIYAMSGISFTIAIYYIVIHVKRHFINLKAHVLKKYRFINRLYLDKRYKTFIMTCSSLVLNMMFAVFNGIVGIMHHSAWFLTLSAYYVFLSLMRLMIIVYELKVSKRKQTKDILLHELKIYANCGVLLVFMTITLIGAVILLINFEGGKSYAGYIIFIVAGYTFYKGVMAIIHLFHMRKLKSPLLKAISCIGYVDACVSVLSLESAMLASFGNGNIEYERMMYFIFGAVVCVMVLFIGVHCIISSKKWKQTLK